MRENVAVHPQKMGVLYVFALFELNFRSDVQHDFLWLRYARICKMPRWGKVCLSVCV